MDPARAWTVFGGASLVLMGAALAGGARRHAADALAWQKQRRQAVGAPEPVPPPLPPVRAYRAGGALLALAGAALAAGAQTGLVRARGAAESRPGAVLIGTAIAACGVGLGTLKILAARTATAPRPLGERLGDAALWTLCALWTAFGTVLVREALR